MVKIEIPETLAPECQKCHEAVITEWDAPSLVIEGKDMVKVPFRIHLDRYSLDTTKFKLIDYKSTPIESTCGKCGKKLEANLLFDDEGRSFGIFTEAVTDRYLFQHSSGIVDKEQFLKDLLSLEFLD